MIDKERVREQLNKGKERLRELTEEGRGRFEELRTEGKERLEELNVSGSELKAKVKEIIEEGKARKITIKKGNRVLAEFPLVVGAGGAVAAVILAPTLAAVGAIGALAADVSVVIHHAAEDTDEDSSMDVPLVEFTEIRK